MNNFLKKAASAKNELFKRRAHSEENKTEPQEQDQENVVLPSTEQIKTELDRTQYRSRYSRVLRSTIYSLIVVAAIAILVATLWLPVLQIYGTSMEPTLYEGNIVLSIKGSEFETGDIIAFYYNNKILVKRVIGNPGDWIDIDAKGVIYLNNVPLDEPYVDELAIGDCNIKLPYQVPDGRVFVLGDHRATSVDSRNSAVGCVAEEQIVGRLVFRIWPITALTPL